MNFESLEGRQMMAALTTAASVTGSGTATFATGVGNDGMAALFQQQLTRAFERSANLANYTPQEIIDTPQWVLHLGPGGTEAQLFGALGAANLVKNNLIANTYIYTLPGGTNRENIGPTIQATPGVDYAYPLVAHEVNKRFVPNDPLYTSQWHLNNTGQTNGTVGIDANLQLAWDTARGQGIVIGIVDDGVQHTHPDLVGHYLANLSTDLVGGDNDPMGGAGDFHGTAVAGVATANTNNGIGVAGAAPDARFSGIRLLGFNMTDLTESQALTFQSQAIHIYNNSWGPPDGYGGFDAPGPLTIAAFQQAVTTGRGGRGNLLVWAGGNGGSNEDNSNYDAYANSWFTLGIGAIDHTGNRAPYSEPGANILVTTYSLGSFNTTPGITTTDIVGADGYNDVAGASDGDPLADLNYTSQFSGTSSASPLAAGITALLLSANANLTWRDINRILLQTAERVDASDPDWTTNGAGYAINHNYGFGSIDAAAAVALAGTWTNLPAATTLTAPANVPVNLPIPDNNTGGAQFTLAVTQDLSIEQVELIVDIQHSSPEDLEVTLQSPDGTISIMAEPHSAVVNTSNQLRGWSFTSVRHYGEQTRGNWIVSVRDRVQGTAGTFNSMRLNFIGTPSTGGGATRIQGAVFDDANGNGIFEGTEGYLAGVTAFIDANSNGALDAGEPSATTNVSGLYTFNGLTAGAYRVDVVVPPLHTLTSPGAGFYSVTAIANQTVTATAFGIQPPASANGPFILTNGTGDTTLTVGVDGFGSFGSAVGSDADDAIYNPAGAITEAPTTYESGIAIGIGGGARTYLSTGIGSSSLNNPLVTGNSLSGASDFVFNGLLFHLQQNLVPLIDGTGARIGSKLEQTYTITNTSSQAQSFDLVRYFDGDLLFDGTRTDGGGRVVSNGTEIMFETDSATGTADSTTFIGITATGGTQSQTTRYQANTFSDLRADIEAGTPLNQTIYNDGPDPDQFVDAGQGYDITLGLQNIFNLAPGQVGTYTTGTLFGTGVPGEIFVRPPEPPPMVLSGVVTNDLNSNGQGDTGEVGIPNAIVYLDLNNDAQLGLGEPAQVTGNNGAYSFVVRPGTYTVRQATIAGWQPTAPSAGFYTVSGVAGQTIANLFFGNSASTDFGDAPGPYATLTSQGGPSHSIIPGFYMGSGVDGEGDGQPTPTASGDDVATSDDDDGIVFVSPLTPGQASVVDVTIHNGGRSSGFLHGWIDFNADGDWNDAGERVFSNQRVVDGVNRLSIPVPAGATLGNTYARFRYGYGNAIGATGAVLGGEVEDYRVAIVAGQPIARPDSYVIAGNTTGNRLDVLVNDIGSALGPITIVSATNGNLGGIVTIGSDQKLVYTPKAALTTGTELISYTISDGKGGSSSTQVTITLGIPTVAPTAIDDVFRVGLNSVANTFNVIPNDLAPQSPISTVIVNQATTKGGYVAVNAGTTTLRYTPAFNFVGLDQFEYTVVDARGLQSKAIVTVHVGANTTDDLAGLELTFTDTLGAPLTSVTVGSEFQLHISARDRRNAPTDPGVLAAYLDVLYNRALVAPKTAANAYGVELTFNSAFDISRSASAALAGLLDEVGAARSTTPADAGPIELVKITFIAQALGTATFTADPANQAINHDVRMGSPAFTVGLDKVTYGTGSISVVAGPAFRNTSNIRDVSGDSRVSPIDALLVINELNTRGSSSLIGRTLSTTNPVYLDVNGDNMVSPLDALLIINYLNSVGKGSGEDASYGSTPEAESDDLFEDIAEDVAGAWKN